MAESLIGSLFLLLLIGLSWGYFFLSCSFRGQSIRKQVTYNAGPVLAYLVVLVLLTVSYLVFIAGPMLPGGCMGLGEGIALGLLSTGIAGITIAMRILAELAYLAKKGWSNKAL